MHVPRQVERDGGGPSARPRLFCESRRQRCWLPLTANLCSSSNRARPRSYGPRQASTCWGSRRTGMSHCVRSWTVPPDGLEAVAQLAPMLRQVTVQLKPGHVLTGARKESCEHANHRQSPCQCGAYLLYFRGFPCVRPRPAPPAPNEEWSTPLTPRGSLLPALPSHAHRRPASECCFPASRLVCRTYCAYHICWTHLIRRRLSQSCSDVRSVHAASQVGTGRAYHARQGKCLHWLPLR